MAFGFFKKQKNKDTKYKRRMFYDIKPFVNIKYNLIFAKCDMLYEDSSVCVMARIFNKVLVRYVIVTDFDGYKELSLSNTVYKTNGKFEHISASDLDNKNVIEIIMIEQMNETTLLYAIKNTTANANYYKNILVYNEKEVTLDQYGTIRNFGPLYKEFCNSMYVDLAAVDKEVL